MSAYKVRLEVWIESADNYGQDGRLRVSEEVTVEAGSFLEVAKILGQFHDVAQLLKAAPAAADAAPLGGDTQP